MNDSQIHIDITTNVKIIEFLKGEMLTDVAELFKLMNKDSKEVRDTAIDVLANIIIESYVLGRRMGISYDSIDLQLKEKLRAGIQENNDMEKLYKDLSTLSNKLLKH